MWTGSGFVRASFLTDRALFTAAADKDFDDDFLKEFDEARGKLKPVGGAALRTSAGTLVTDRLYASMDKVGGLLDLLDIRLGLADATKLTVKVKDFGLKGLRDRIGARDAEGVSSRLSKLEEAIAANQDYLVTKGYKAQELADLKKLHKDIDDDNLLQDKGENSSQDTTDLENDDYTALNTLLGKLMRTGRLLFKRNKKKRQRYEAAGVLKRMQAGEKPGDGEGEA
jgi:hypothetical protein